MVTNKKVGLDNPPRNQPSLIGQNHSQTLALKDKMHSNVIQLCCHCHLQQGYKRILC